MVQFLKIEGFLLVAVGLGGTPPLSKKIAFSPHVPPLFCPPKVGFCNFHAGFGYFAQIVSPQVDPICGTLKLRAWK